MPASRPAEDAQLYRNVTFAFHFEIPYGWVDRTKEMGESGTADKPDARTGSPGAEEKPSNGALGEVLLAVFERPPGAIGQTINSAVVIASESSVTYPGLKRAEDYIGPLTELTTSKGFKVDGDPVALEIDSRQLVRVDFTKPLVTKTNDALTMHQCTLILLAKGRIVSFTLIAGSDDEVDKLIGGLHFGAAKSQR